MGSASEDCKGRRPTGPEGPILLGLGANLPSPKYGPPVATLQSCLKALEARGLRLRSRSRWWESEPVPRAEQPWYVNGVAEIATSLGPEALLAQLHEVEAEFGRLRSLPNAPRITSSRHPRSSRSANSPTAMPSALLMQNSAPAWVEVRPSPASIASASAVTRRWARLRSQIRR